jgi:DNA-binding transcriptional MocR family regulator
MPIEPRLGQWAEAWFAREIAVPFAVNLASGAIDALERLLCALLLPGDGVVVEDPCFLSSINMVRYAGFTPARWRWMPKGWILTGWRRRYATARGR